jgi:3D (Asp-Asp-Asp) domain-containing protein
MPLSRRLLCGLAAVAMALVCTNANAATTTDPVGEVLRGLQIAGEAAMKTPKLVMKATYYFLGAKGVGGKDSMGCRTVPMRTLAVDPRVLPKGSVVYIKETVGLPMPDGSLHDGLWYASDTGGAIKGQRIDLYTGAGARSAKAIKTLNLQSLSVSRVSSFEGCPPAS